MSEIDAIKLVLALILVALICLTAAVTLLLLIVSGRRK
jgi:hypothetical protein